MGYEVSCDQKLYIRTWYGNGISINKIVEECFNSLREILVRYVCVILYASVF